MCYAGALGKTRDELRNVLSFNVSDTIIYNELSSYIRDLVDKKFSGLTTANRVYASKTITFVAAYLNIIQTYFNAEAKRLDFANASASAASINKWVNDTTNGKINDLISPSQISADTQLILVNTIYFKGYWKVKFNKAQTIKDTFTLITGDKVTVDMMKMSGKYFNCLKDKTNLDAEVCEFLFQDEKMAMTIILPYRNSSLSQVEAQLNATKFKFVMSRPKMSTKVNFNLPRFKTQFKADVNFF